MTIMARALTPGTAQGQLALLSSPLSLWGGLDLASGAICDVNHPEHGRSVAGNILAMTSARGSSSSSSALVEAVRRGTAPAAIILGRIDPILVIGSLVAADLYGIAVPILLVAEESWLQPYDGTEVAIATSGDSGEIAIRVQTQGAG